MTLGATLVVQVGFLETKLNVLFFLNRLVDLCFFADMVLNFFIPYQVSGGRTCAAFCRPAVRLVPLVAPRLGNVVCHFLIWVRGALIVVLQDVYGVFQHDLHKIASRYMRVGPQPLTSPAPLYFA